MKIRFILTIGLACLLWSARAQVAFTVTNTADTGPGSLRQAILDANSNTNGTMITFRIPGPGVHTIIPSTALPFITSGMTIDGYSQTNASPNTLTNDNNATLLIELDGELLSNAYGLYATASDVLIRGLVINRFTWGIGTPSGPQHISVQGCFLGTDPSGTNALGMIKGIELYSSNSAIGGPGSGEGNLISGNTFGIYMTAGGSCTIQGNLVGTDIHGRSAGMGNQTGIALFGYGQSSVGNTIGGTTLGARNVISGNGTGVHIEGQNAVGNTISGNYIGTDVTGTFGLGNSTDGISIGGGSTGNTVGGTNSGAGNIIAYNAGTGVRIYTNADSFGDIWQTTNTAVLGNSIFANGKLGISLGNGSTPTPNDPGDADVGPNNLQNYPVITSVTPGPTNIIHCTLNSNSNTTYRIEFFTSVGPDATGYGEGQTFLGAAIATTDGSGNAATDFVCPCSLDGQWMTATATDTNCDNTSEFSGAKRVLQPPVITLQPTSQTNTAGALVSFSVQVSGTPPFAFRWQKNEMDLLHGGNVSGATNPSLTLSNISSSDAAAYRVMVTNAAGSVTSLVASFTVLYPPVIVTQPSSFQTVAGASAIFSIEANGTEPLFFRWHKNGTDVTSATNALVNLTGSEFTILRTSADDGGLYLVIVTNSAGSVTSSPAILTVTDGPAIVAQPENQTKTVGAPASFGVFALGSGPLTFQWQRNGTNLVEGGTVIGAAAATLRLASVSLADAGTYSVVISNAAGGVRSAVATLTVLDAPAIGMQPASRTNVLGTTATFTALAFGSLPITYHWQKDGLDLTNSQNIAGATSTTLSVLNVSSNDDAGYRLIASNFAGSATSVVASLVILAPLNFDSNRLTRVESFSLATNGALTLRWASQPNRVYRVLERTNLAQSRQWQPIFGLGPVPGAAGPTTTITMPMLWPVNMPRFFTILDVTDTSGYEIGMSQIPDLGSTCSWEVYPDIATDRQVVHLGNERTAAFPEGTQVWLTGYRYDNRAPTASPFDDPETRGRTTVWCSCQLVDNSSGSPAFVVPTHAPAGDYVVKIRPPGSSSPPCLWNSDGGANVAGTSGCLPDDCLYPTLFVAPPYVVATADEVDILGLHNQDYQGQPVPLSFQFVGISGYKRGSGSLEETIPIQFSGEYPAIDKVSGEPFYAACLDHAGIQLDLPVFVGKEEHMRPIVCNDQADSYPPPYNDRTYRHCSDPFFDDHYTYYAFGFSGVRAGYSLCCGGSDFWCWVGKIAGIAANAVGAYVEGLQLGSSYMDTTHASTLHPYGQGDGLGAALQNLVQGNLNLCSKPDCTPSEGTVNAHWGPNPDEDWPSLTQPGGPILLLGGQDYLSVAYSTRRVGGLRLLDWKVTLKSVVINSPNFLNYSLPSVGGGAWHPYVDDKVVVHARAYLYRAGDLNQALPGDLLSTVRIPGVGASPNYISIPAFHSENPNAHPFDALGGSPEGVILTQSDPDHPLTVANAIESPLLYIEIGAWDLNGEIQFDRGVYSATGCGRDLLGLFSTNIFLADFFAFVPPDYGAGDLREYPDEHYAWVRKATRNYHVTFSGPPGNKRQIKIHTDPGGEIDEYAVPSPPEITIEFGVEATWLKQTLRE